MYRENLAAAEVESMSYVEFISLLRETNRCPGGKDSVRTILQNAHIDRQAQVLEIGSNTGFTSLEIARTAKCKVIGIDVVRAAVEESRRALSEDTPEIQDLVRFEVGSAYDIPFKNSTFDLVVCGGATSFMEDKNKATNEYVRVMKPWGFLSITNLAYFSEPPAKVVDKVSSVIGVRIEPWSDAQWLRQFAQCKALEPYWLERKFLGSQTPERIQNYVETFMRKPHLADLSPTTREAIRDRWLNTINVFNENHAYLGFIMALYRKRYVQEEPELFFASDNQLGKAMECLG